MERCKTIMRSSYKIVFTCLLLTITLLLSGCQTGSLEVRAKEIREIVLYKMNSFTEIVEESKLYLKDKKTINLFNQILKKAIKLPGIVDIAAPSYGFEIGKKRYFLWVNEDTKSGSLMDADDTHTLYRLSKETVPPLLELIKELEHQGIGYLNIR